MSKQILTDKETKHFLMKAFGCTQQFVWQALTFRRDSETARRIRVLALKRGGKLVDGYVPKCETTHEEVEKTMTQTFGPRVKLVVDKETGDVSVYVDGQLKDSYKNITVPDLMQLQGEVQLMAAAL
ncbi:hypothetical protein [Phocaeicola plebeius]|uniref:Uncharacterized protein n=1 Tax=Phocaeicola plebeius TaxID=310297 RepID=A0A921L5S5_9BACT|nr:hypothetical protein [Phocaeicola plebeius]HJF81262.1 hypothetical protein [Phocaeicola plebeius]